MIEGHMFGNTIWAGHWLWMLLVAIAIVIPFWRICQRAGYPGWMGLASLNFQVQHPSFRVLSCRETTHTCRLRSAV